MRLDGRDVVVTGGSGALGGAVIDRLLELGATCFVPVRSADSAGKLSRPERERLRIGVGVDLTDDDSVRSYYEEVPSLWASIHVAGGFAMAPVEEVSARDFSGMMTQNALSTFLCCREAIRRLRRGGGGGRIVNVTAQPGVEPRRGAKMAAYAASKAAVAALTEALAEETAGSGIWVNAVAPSILDTPANREAIPDADFSKWPKVEEVAEVVAFLASPENRVARGTIVKVYGRS